MVITHEPLFILLYLLHFLAVFLTQAIYKYFMKKVLLIILFLLFLKPGSVSAEQINTTDKLITVDTAAQTLTAWNNGRQEMNIIVSTGLNRTPTVLGKFKIYAKLPLQDMRGYSLVNGRYFHKDVPYVMYFYRGYAIHGAYWHNNFGSRMSNGCVNLSVDDARRLYEWAEFGTQVIVF